MKCAKSAARLKCFSLAVLFLIGSGCSTQTAEPGSQVELVQAQSEIAEADLLDVGIQVFDPGLPPEDEPVPPGVFPEVRNSEARYIAIHLKETMQGTGQWGAVRVVPAGDQAVDVSVTGKIVDSSGKKLVVMVRAIDSTGRQWFERKYKQLAEFSSYAENQVEDREPYQYLYNKIANDLLVARAELGPEDLRELREVSALKFAADLAPSAFSDYLSRNRKGRYSVSRLPAEDDPMMRRIAVVREREYMFVDTLNQHYANFYGEMEEPYDSWRKYSYEEQMALDAIRRKARTQKIIGAIALLGAMFAQVDSGAEAAVRDAAAIGGMAAIQAGMATSQEAKIHVEALKELGASLEAEVEPLVIEVEGQTLRLTGSAETQYEKWRRLLREIYASETGLPLDPNTDDMLSLSEPSEG
jgi:hypothetical protein